MSSSIADLEKYRIPLEEIIRATSDFSSETKIGDGGFGSVHKGQLSEQWQNRIVAIKRLNPDGYQGNKEFDNELEMVASFDHKNIINFIGFCDDANQMIIVYDYAINGSLDYHIQNPDKRRCLTWEQRLRLCLGAATGLEYLHSGLGETKRVIHRDVKSANILLDENLDAKICDFGFSRFGARNQENTQILTRVAGTRFYMDPVYAERSRLTKESDIYSFGVVMFEISSGALVYHHRCFGDAEPQYLIDLIRNYYDDDEKAAGPDNLIDPFIRGHMNMNSFHMFNNIAHRCLNLKPKERPTMDQIIRTINDALDIQLAQNTFSSINTRSLESFVIPLEEINLATQFFSKEQYVTTTKFGVVYKGQLSKRWSNPTAITRLSPECYRGENELYNELQMISFFHHQNILHFIGYCDEAGERIIVHEYAVNGSLRDHIYDWDKLRCLTWAQRLKICIGAAKGLQFLQLYHGEDSEVIRGKVNIGNIMFDENMVAKIIFFRLSKQSATDDVPNKSDILSLGVILCEVLSGRQAAGFVRWGNSDNEQDCLDQFVEDYRSGQMDEYVDKFIKSQIDSRCYNIFKEVAYKCIITDISWTQGGIHAVFGRKNEEAPPSIDMVIERLEYAANFQELEDSSSYRGMVRSGPPSWGPRGKIRGI